LPLSDIHEANYLEELLIDFRELLGEHSGDNMAEAVWETLKQYDLVGRVRSFAHIVVTP
jgi:hypothetical protein